MTYETTGLVPNWFNIEVDGICLSSSRLIGLYASYLGVKKLSGLEPVAGWRELINEAVCDAHPRYMHRVPPPSKGGVSIAGALSFVKLAFSRLLDNSFVDATKARQRAAVCSCCPLAGEVMGCPVCKFAIRTAVRLSPPEELVIPEACGACGCWLPLKAWLPRKCLGKMSDHPYHPECWMLSEPQFPELVQTNQGIVGLEAPCAPGLKAVTG